MSNPLLFQQTTEATKKSVIFLLCLRDVFVHVAGSLQEVLQIHDVLARVYLARLCYILSRARVLDGRLSTAPCRPLNFFWSNYSTLCWQLWLLTVLLVLAERPEVKTQFTTILYQLLLDPSERVCFEAITCILGKFDATERCVLLSFTFLVCSST